MTCLREDNISHGSRLHFELTRMKIILEKIILERGAEMGMESCFQIGRETGTWKAPRHLHLDVLEFLNLIIVVIKRIITYYGFLLIIEKEEAIYRKVVTMLVFRF